MDVLAGSSLVHLLYIMGVWIPCCFLFSCAFFGRREELRIFFYLFLLLVEGFE